jgi:MFS family permease
MCDYSYLDLPNHEFESHFQLSEFIAINTNSTSETSKCSSHIFNRAKHSNFSSFFGGEWNSIGTEFQMVCDKSWQNGLISASTFIGFAMGSIFGGSFADKYGRKFAMMVFSVLLGIVMIIHGFCPGTIWSFAFFRLSVLIKIGF